MRIVDTLLIVVSCAVCLIVLIISVLIFQFTFKTPSPPLIAEYEFEGTELQWAQHLSNVDSMISHQVIFTDTTGNFPLDYNVYFEVTNSDSCFFYSMYSVASDDPIAIALISAYDLKTHRGGYSNSEDEIIFDLEKRFATEVIKNKHYH